MEIVFERDKRNVLEMMNKIEYDLRTKIKVSNDKKRLNSNHRKLLDSMKMKLKEKKKTHDKTMVVWKKRKKNGWFVLIS
jgi:hypothetical protein